MSDSKKALLEAVINQIEKKKGLKVDEIEMFKEDIRKALFMVNIGGVIS
jgi:hypothetical protein